MKNVKEINVKVEGQRWGEALDKAFTRANNKVAIDGFRKGKAPKDAFIKKYGEQALYMDAADIVINEEYIKTIEANQDLEIMSEPTLELNNVGKDGVDFTIKLILKPVVKLGKYKGLDVKKDEVKVTKEEIEAEIHLLQHRYEEIVIKDGKAALGDTVSIDFAGFKDGVAFDGGTSTDYDLKLGSNTFIPGFEEQLVGLAKGDKKDVEVKFPEDYHAEDLKGAPVVFKVEVKEVKTTQIPGLNEAFFEDLGMEGINDKESLEAQLEENIKVRKEAEAENKYIDALLEAASKNVEVDIPEEIVHSEIHRMMHQYEDNLKMQGLTLEQFYQYTNSNAEALEEQMRDEAFKRVLYRFMLEAIAKEEDFTVTDEDALAEAAKISAKYQLEQEKFLELFGGLEAVKQDIKMRNAIEVLKA